MTAMIKHEFGAPGLFQDDFRKWSRAEWQIVNNITMVDISEAGESGQVERISHVLSAAEFYDLVKMQAKPKQKAQWKRETLGRRR